MYRRLILVAFVFVVAALQGCAGGFPERGGSKADEPQDELSAYSTAD